MRDPLFERLDEWRRQLRLSFHYMAVLRKLRRKGLWPPPVKKPLHFASSRVLIARGDRFGDMMITVPFLARVQASGARVCVLTPDPTARAVLSTAGVDCLVKPSEAKDFAPDLVLLPTPCRTLRSQRHPERWEFVMELLMTLPGTPVVAPALRRAEALSLYTGPCVTPTSGHTALSVLERFADGLGLPAAPAPLLGRWTRDASARARGAVVLNLSAGRSGESDRRDLAIGFWSEVASALTGDTPIASIVQPSDRERRAQAESDPVLSKGEVACFENVTDAAGWLGRQRLLVSPETGLCHLARNLSLPMVVLTPPGLFPYFFPRSPDTGFVFSRSLDDIVPRQVVDVARSLLERL